MTARTALVGGTVIDGLGGPPIVGATILIEGDRIAEVGIDVDVPDDAEVTDLSGRYVVPGLIDVHVHHFEWMGELFVAHGVTSVKDVGNDVSWIATARDELGPGASTGPRIYYTGNGLDVPPPRRDHFIGLENADMARRVVRLLHEHGAIAIKVRECLPVELLSPVVDEAHQLGLKVTGHLRRMEAREAALAGIDGLEHASGVVGATIDPWLTIDLDHLERQDVYAKYVAERKSYALIHEGRAGELAQLLAERDVALIPTMSGWWRMATPRRDRFAEEDRAYAVDPALAYVPDDARSIWSTSQLYRIDDPEDLEQLRVGYAKLQRFMRTFHDAGGTILAGSDTFVSVPGLSLQRELLFLVDAGFTPIEAISMATHRNAEFIGQAHDIGALTPGRLADIVVLAADPTIDIQHIGSIEAVMMSGRTVDTSYHPDYRVPTPRPVMERPLWIERRLAEEGYQQTGVVDGGVSLR